MMLPEQIKDFGIRLVINYLVTRTKLRRTMEVWERVVNDRLPNVIILSSSGDLCYCYSSNYIFILCLFCSQ